MTHEQCKTLTFLQIQNTKCGFQKFRSRDLEQFIARIGIEDMREHFSVIAARIKAGMFQCIGDLFTDQRNILGQTVIG